MILRECKIIFKDVNVEGKSYPIKKAKDVYRFVKDIDLENSPTEYLLVIALNDDYHPVNHIVMGNSNEEEVSFTISSVLRFVLLTGMTKFIVAHNHPNGDSRFSSSDRESNKSIRKASMIIGLDFVGDYLVLKNKCLKMRNGGKH